MENSIPLKEIAGFLPYKLEVQYINNSTNRKIRAYITALSFINVETTYKRKIKGCSGDLIGWTGHNNVNDLKFKPIVRPLSDLTKEIIHNGKKIKPYEILFPVDEFDELFDDNSLKRAEQFLSCREIVEWRFPMEFWEKLKELHFDIYDWIKAGKAIDINTL